MANMLSAVDLSDMSAENIRAARAIDIDFACESVLATGREGMIYHCLRFLTTFLLHHEGKNEATNTNKRNSHGYPVQAVELVLTALASQPRLVKEPASFRLVTDFLSAYIKQVDCFSVSCKDVNIKVKMMVIWVAAIKLSQRKTWALSVSVMLALGYRPGAPAAAAAMVQLLRSKRTSAIAFTSLWIDALRHNYLVNERYSSDYVTEMADYLGALMDLLLVGGKDRDVVLFLGVIRACLDQDMRVAGTNCYYILPLWKSLWELIRDSHLHRMNELAMYLIEVGALLFHSSCAAESGECSELFNYRKYFTDDKVAEVLSLRRVPAPPLGGVIHELSSREQESAVDTGVSVLLCLCCGHCDLNFSVSALSSCMRLVRSSEGGMFSNIERVLWGYASLLGSRSLPKSLQYSLLLDIDGFLRSRPFGRTFEDSTTALESIAICKSEGACVGSDDMSQSRKTRLSAECNYLKLFYAQCLPKVLAVLGCSSHHDTSTRTLKLCESILLSKSIGIDPFLLIKGVRDASEEAQHIFRNVLSQRPLHRSGVMEICSAVINEQFANSKKGFDFSTCSQVIYLTREVVQLPRDELTFGLNALDEIDLISDDTVRVFDSFAVVLYAIIFVRASPAPIARACLRFADQIRSIKIKLTEHTVYALEICIWLHLLKVVLDVDLDLVPMTALQSLALCVYPDLLVVPEILGAAASLAQRLPGGVQILYQSIGHYQDDAITGGYVYKYTRYIALIAASVLANANEVKAKHKAIYLQEIANSSRPQGEEVAKEGIGMLNIETATLPPPETSQGGAVGGFGVGQQDKSYMHEFIVQQEVSRRETIALEESMSESSFLGCFLPFVVALSADATAPLTLRVAGLRALEQYMKCSPDLTKQYSQLITSILLGPTENGSSCFALKIQALAIWASTYSLVSDPAVPINLIASLSLLEPKSDGACCTMRNDDESVRLAMCCVDVMASLVEEGQIRSPEHYGVAMSLPFLFCERADEGEHGLDDLARYAGSRLLFLCSTNFRLLSRVLGFLIHCEDGEAIWRDDPAALKLVSLLSSSSHIKSTIILTLVTLVQQSASSELYKQLEEVALNLLQEIMAGGECKLVFFLEHFPVSDHCKERISEAVKLGTLSSLPVEIGERLRLHSLNLSAIRPKPSPAAVRADHGKAIQPEQEGEQVSHRFYRTGKGMTTRDISSLDGIPSSSNAKPLIKLPESSPSSVLLKNIEKGKKIVTRTRSSNKRAILVRKRPRLVLSSDTSSDHGSGSGEEDCC